MTRFWDKSLYRWVILGACIFVYVTSQIVRWNYASITGYLMTDLHIGKPELGVLGSAFFYAYGLAQIPWGTAHDVWGGRRVIPVGIAALSFFLAGFAFASSYTEAIGWRIGMGFMAAAGFVPNNALLSKWFSVKERGFALETYSAVGGGLGEVMIFLLMPLIALFLGDSGTLFGLGSWRGSTLIMGGVIMVIAVASALLLRSDPADIGLPSIQKAEDKKGHDENYREVVLNAIKDPALWLISLCWSGFIVAARLVPGWLPLYAADYYIQTAGMAKAQAAVAGGVIVTMYVLGRVFGTPLVGKLSDYLLRKFQTPRSTVITLTLIANALMFYAFTLPMPSVIALGALAMISGCVVNAFPLINAACAEIWSIRTAGFNNGIINTVGQFSGATALGMSGYWAVKYSVAGGAYNTEFQGIWYLGIITSCLAAAAGLYVIYREKKAFSTHTQALTPPGH